MGRRGCSRKPVTEVKVGRLQIFLMNPEIRRILNQVPGWSAPACVVTTLDGGITNRNYRVEVANEIFVVRVGGEGAHLLGIDRCSEYTASSTAAQLGVGAEVICFLDSENALITRFIPGHGITPDDAAQPEMLRRIVTSIRSYHTGPAFPGVFSPFETIRSYHELASRRSVRFPETLPRVFELMGMVEQALGSPSQAVPCHNDLLAANFIDDGQTIRVLDWEYAGMGDLFFDLGNFAAHQRLGRNECELLLKYYFGEVRPHQLAHLCLMRLASDLRESFWGFLQSGISKLEFDFGKYALEHLNRFLQNVATPEFSRWLREVKP